MNCPFNVGRVILMVVFRKGIDASEESSVGWLMEDVCESPQLCIDPETLDPDCWLGTRFSLLPSSQLLFIYCHINQTLRFVSSFWLLKIIFLDLFWSIYLPVEPHRTKSPLHLNHWLCSVTAL